MMELILGRESGNGRLHIVVNGKDCFYGTAGSVPRSVSRQHCKLVIGDDGNYTIVNLKPENVTYVNGVSVVSKRIVPKTDRVELGGERYLLPITVILKAVLGGAEPPKTYSIAHLQKVWDEYHDTKLEIQIKEKKTAAIRSVTGMFSMAAVACGFIPGISDFTVLRILLYAVGFLLAIYFFVKLYRSSSEMPRFMDALDKKFRKEYVCPNPDCNKFMGYVPYEELKNQTRCPSCKSKLVEKA